VAGRASAPARNQSLVFNLGPEPLRIACACAPADSAEDTKLLG
jgi:hypothetical protein